MLCFPIIRFSRWCDLVPGVMTVVCLIVLNLELFAEVNFQLPVILDTLSSVQISSVMFRAGYCVISGLRCWKSPPGSTEEIPVRGQWRDTSRDEMYVCMSNMSLSSVSDASGCSMIALLHTGAVKFSQNLLPRARQAVCSLLPAGVLKGYSSIVSRKLASHGFGASMAAMSSFPPQRYHYFLVLDFEATCDKPQIHPQVSPVNYPLASCCCCSERWKENTQCWLTDFLWFVPPLLCCWSSRALASYLLSQLNARTIWWEWSEGPWFLSRKWQFMCYQNHL